MDRFIAVLTLAVDIGILWILIAEYNFDRIIYEKGIYKRRIAHAKKKEAIQPIQQNPGSVTGHLPI